MSMFLHFYWQKNSGDTLWGGVSDVCVFCGECFRILLLFFFWGNNNISGVMLAELLYIQKFTLQTFPN